MDKIIQNINKITTYILIWVHEDDKVSDRVNEIRMEEHKLHKNKKISVKEIISVSVNSSLACKTIHEFDKVTTEEFLLLLF